MADPRKRRSENVPGNFFVDSTCIDCGMCFWMAGDTFREENDMATVYHQPSTEMQLFEAAQALVSCPVGSIGTEKPIPQIKTAIESFPFPLAEDLFLTGFHSKKAYGATSYLLKHPDGNIMVDSPRFLGTLAKKIEALGGIKTIFLTHLDDIGDHDLYHKHFGCERVILKDDWNPGMGEMKSLRRYSFEWVLPGHGERYHADEKTMKSELEKCIAWMETR